MFSLVKIIMLRHIIINITIDIMIIGMNSANPFLLLAITKGLSEQLNAGQIIKELASSLGLGGGGPKHFGTIGFKNKDLYKKAYSSLIKLVERF